MEKRGGSFSSLRAYGVALLETPRRLVQRMGAVSSCNEELTRVKARSGAEMQRSLRWFDLLALGIGGMVGAGVFVTTGKPARTLAGPSIILSYVIAGVSALLSALCYTEFAVAMPVAGGAFSYLRTTFGEFPAYITGANLVMEYVVSNAAVARSFTSYFDSAIGFNNIDKWRLKVHVLPEGFNELDLIAVALIIVLTICICYSTKESSAVNMVLTVLHLAFILFIIVIGFAKGNVNNLTEPANPANPGGFAPYGVNGVFNAAAIVYFSYIGYDAVSTMAEEVTYHATDIPIGVSGSVIIVTVLYGLMATALCTLVPYDKINEDAPLSMAFRNDPGWEWVSNVVGAGASLGILTSLLVAMLGQARYMCVIGRSHVIPDWFAKVNSKTGTPLNASIFLGICTAAIGLFTDVAILIELISIGTLFVSYMVANALIYKRYAIIEKKTTLAFLWALSWIAIGFASLWQFQGGRGQSCCLAICGLAAIIVTFVFSALVAEAKQPREWGVSCMPWTAAASIFLNVFLLGSLYRISYLRFAIFSVVATIFYLVYSVHASYDAQCRAASLALVPPAAVEIHVIE
uniref:Catalase n=1 Tax=Larix gmelinii var. olgensis TaxID=188928 RepID=A0A7S6PS64_9CONI|nr:catalase [Larix gmelinii var. olgensis]